MYTHKSVNFPLQIRRLLNSSNLLYVAEHKSHVLLSGVQCKYLFRDFVERDLYSCVIRAARGIFLVDGIGYIQLDQTQIRSLLIVTRCTSARAALKRSTLKYFTLLQRHSVATTTEQCEQINSRQHSCGSDESRAFWGLRTVTLCQFWIFFVIPQKCCRRLLHIIRENRNNYLFFRLLVEVFLTRTLRTMYLQTWNKTLQLSRLHDSNCSKINALPGCPSLALTAESLQHYGP